MKLEQMIGENFNIQGSGPLTGNSSGSKKKERGRIVALTWAKRKQYGGV